MASRHESPDAVQARPLELPRTQPESQPVTAAQPAATGEAAPTGDRAGGAGVGRRHPALAAAPGRCGRRHGRGRGPARRRLAGGPVFLALVVVVALAPVQSWLRRHGAPRWLATTVLLLLVWTVLLAFVALLVAVRRAAGHPPAQLRRAGQFLSTSGRPTSTTRASCRASCPIWSRQIDYGQVVGLATGVCSQPHRRREHPGPAAVGPGVHGHRVQRLPPPHRAGRRGAPAPAGGAAPLFAQGTRSYLLVSTVFGADRRGR